MKNEAAILHRLRIVEEDIDTIRRRAPFIGMEGGPHAAFFDVAFHERRRDLLLWMLIASDADINAKRLAVEQALGPAALLKYDHVAMLPAQVAEQIAMLQLLEYALDMHPHQIKRRHVRAS
jgi:hypothetical protein